MTEQFKQSLDESDESDEQPKILAADIELHSLKTNDEVLLAATLQGTLAIAAYQLQRAERNENDERQLLRGKEPTDEAPVRQKVYLFDPETYAFNSLHTTDGTGDNDTLAISEALAPRRISSDDGSDPKPIVWPNGINNQRSMEFDGKGNITWGAPVDSPALEAWNSVLVRSVPIDEAIYHHGARLYAGSTAFSSAERREIEQGLEAGIERAMTETQTHGIA